MNFKVLGSNKYFTNIRDENILDKYNKFFDNAVQVVDQNLSYHYLRYYR